MTATLNNRGMFEQMERAATVVGAPSAAAQRAAVEAFNRAFGYDLIWPVDPEVARDLAELAVALGKPDIGEQFRAAWRLPLRVEG